ncbi:uncharacterized protein EV422DRAFT_218629 [Fimicolochytrium jonesii]|uniref:uncharacterized protein n=1 Tax=Fimicolochytrium jonesii TaxID=1396493 RepID=UPI0022FF37B7|nr:uncharacterized protein EV422DRAFT_218629 [Fimicolochytrium jonesii]KAI8817570.1 hypothetical protein EV422DRAFT_218629 [Fimicolochytrium jonesii]
MSSPADVDFEAAITLLRDTYRRKCSSKDDKISQLSSELRRKDAEIKELWARVDALQAENEQARHRMAEMSRSVNKLANFKQSVMASLAAEDAEDVTLAAEKTQPAYHVAAASALRPRKRDEQVNHRGNVGTPRDTNLQAENDNESLHDEDVTLADHVSHPEALFNTTQLFARRSSLSDGLDGRPQTSSHHQRDSNPDASDGDHLPNDKSRTKRVLTTPPRKSTVIADRTANPAATSSASVAFGNIEIIPRPDSPFSTSATTTVSGHSGVASALGNVVPNSADGRDFFKRARHELSYDEFTELLWHVKAYNNREQSRKYTLEVLEKLIAKKHERLYDSFKRLVQG